METKTFFTDLEFAQLGEGQIAYLKRVKTDDLLKNFPGLPPLTPGVELWGLFGAAGEPIILSDVRSQVLASAHEQDLETVTLQ